MWASRFWSYVQRTKAVADGRPLHAETGYLRVPQPGRVELVLAHPNGITEIDVGTYTVTGDVIDVELSIDHNRIGARPPKR